MAYSPSPHPAHAGTGLSLASSSFNTARYRINQRSPSPPPQQSLNKRDKKRIAMAERLTEISNNFAENRDSLYRERLRGFQVDIAYINGAQLYDNKPLDDMPRAKHTDQERGLNAQSQASANISTSSSQLGKHAARFAQDINAALEDKDARLVDVAVSFFTLCPRLTVD